MADIVTFEPKKTPYYTQVFFGGQEVMISDNDTLKVVPSMRHRLSEAHTHLIATMLTMETLLPLEDRILTHAVTAVRNEMNLTAYNSVNDD